MKMGLQSELKFQKFVSALSYTMKLLSLFHSFTKTKVVIDIDCMAVRLSKSNFHCADKIANQLNLCMKMCRNGHETQIKCVEISKIILEEVIFTVLRSKARILKA